MTSRKTLANAIRFLSMDAVQRQIPDTPAHQWAWLISRKYCGATI